MVGPLKQYNLSRLPEPDQYGNYWFSRDKKDEFAPVIFLITSEKNQKGKYCLYRGQKGYVFELDGKFKAFDKPEDALRYLRAEWK